MNIGFVDGPLFGEQKDLPPGKWHVLESHEGNSIYEVIGERAYHVGSLTDTQIKGMLRHCDRRWRYSNQINRQALAK